MTDAAGDAPAENGPPWSVNVLTLFPEWFSWLRDVRPIRNVLESGLLEFAAHDMRPFSPSKHRVVDDTPYGGGAGMVLRVDVVVPAVEGVLGMPLEEARERTRIVLLSPAGEPFTDATAEAWAAERRPTTILCGRYEGFDHRVHEHVATEEVSLGPYVLSGGELAAMAMVDATVRKLPGALGNDQSLVDETFSEGVDGGSEYPHYTRPPEFRGWGVPEILLGGHHAQIAAWRREQSRLRTEARQGSAEG
jgi:tRNA (guanine37-N1)-methyltransferase